ncbi:hypothetical protein ACWEK7_18120, partial [Streptomyces californicus]
MCTGYAGRIRSAGPGYGAGRSGHGLARTTVLVTPAVRPSGPRLKRGVAMGLLGDELAFGRALTAPEYESVMALGR